HYVTGVRPDTALKLLIADCRCSRALTTTINNQHSAINNQQSTMSPRSLRFVGIRLRLGMARRGVAAAARKRLARAVGETRAEVHLTFSDFLHEIRYEQRRGQRHRYDNRADHVRGLPRYQQLDSEHVRTSAKCVATPVPTQTVRLNLDR